MVTATNHNLSVAQRAIVDWKAELEIVRGKNKHGILDPDKVVEFARNPKTALHKCFEWDDDKAADRFRRDQAEKLIARVTVIVEGSTEPTRMYVSLIEDRKEDGGYRSIVSVLSDKERRERLLDQALADFKAFQEKYKVLQELAPIFAAAEDVRAKQKT